MLIRLRIYCLSWMENTTSHVFQFTTSWITDLEANDLQATVKICIHRLNVKVGATIPTGCFIIKSEGKSMCNGQKSVDCKNFRPRLSLVSGFLTLEWFQAWKPRPQHFFFWIQRNFTFLKNIFYRLTRGNKTPTVPYVHNTLTSLISHPSFLILLKMFQKSWYPT